MPVLFPTAEDLRDIIFGSQLCHIATGGEHLVYISERIPGVVVKISSNTLRFVLRCGEPIDKPSDETLQAIEQEELLQRGERMTRICSYFGSKHTLEERRYLLPVPLSSSLLAAALGGRPSYSQELSTLQRHLSDGAAATAWAVVTVQPYLAAGNALSLVGGYSDDGAKADTLDAMIYSQVTHALVFSGRPIEFFDRQQFLRVQTRRELGVLLETLDHDAALRAAVRSLLRNIYDYVRDTGEILDTAGPGNILLILDGTTWNYLLVDALSIHNEPVLHLARIAVTKLLSGSEITGRERLFLMKALNFLRTVNGIGACVDLNSDIILSDQTLSFGSIDCLRETRQLVAK